MLGKTQVVASLAVLLLLVFANWDSGETDRLLVNQAAWSISIEANPLSEGERLVAFDSIEKAIEDMHVVGSGDELPLGADLVSTLERSTQFFLDNALSELALARIQFLIRQSLPGEPGRHMAELFPVFLDYRRAKQDLQQEMASNQPLTIAEELTYVNALEKLRELHMGREVANRLYRGQGLLQRYLLARRQIMVDQALTDPQRKQRLAWLRAGFKIDRQLVQFE
jgi:Proteobacterial lipase chaperone protein